MGTKYDQFTLEERCEIAQLQAEGHSIRQIAAALDRSPSSVSRELRRNDGQLVGYRPSHAQERTKARRWKVSKLERNANLREEVLALLAKGWSPEQAYAFLERQHGKRVLGPETIYRFIAAQIARHKDYSWRQYLPRAKAKRGWRGADGQDDFRLQRQYLPAIGGLWRGGAAMAGRASGNIRDGDGRRDFRRAEVALSLLRSAA